MTNIMTFCFLICPEMTNRSIPLDGPAQYSFPSPQDSVIGKILLSMGRGRALNSTKPIKVECGPKPSDAATNCKPNKAPCLYNVVKDPCEYHNLADKHPGNIEVGVGYSDTYPINLINIMMYWL